MINIADLIQNEEDDSSESDVDTETPRPVLKLPLVSGLTNIKNEDDTGTGESPLATGFCTRIKNIQLQDTGSSSGS